MWGSVRTNGLEVWEATPNPWRFGHALNLLNNFFKICSMPSFQVQRKRKDSTSFNSRDRTTKPSSSSLPARNMMAIPVSRFLKRTIKGINLISILCLQVLVWMVTNPPELSSAGILLKDWQQKFSVVKLEANLLGVSCSNHWSKKIIVYHFFQAFHVVCRT